MLTVGSLFSGIGGMDLGLERAGMRVVWQCEIDGYASRVLRKHWPHVPNYGDVSRVDWSTVERPDVVAGGFACQDLSQAGKMSGLGEETRSGTTWRELVRAIVSLRPRYVLVENVPMLLSGDGGRWFATVLGALAALGYDAEWDCVPASFVGAPHRRTRLFIVAHTCRHGLEAHIKEPGVFPQKTRQRPHIIIGGAAGTAGFSVGVGSLWEIEPSVVRVVDGVSSRVDRLKGLGNAVVPQVAELIGSWIAEFERRSS